jgi:hypothetical protein
MSRILVVFGSPIKPIRVNSAAIMNRKMRKGVVLLRIAASAMHPPYDFNTAITRHTDGGTEGNARGAGIQRPLL